MGGFLDKYRYAKVSYNNAATIESRISWSKKLKELGIEAKELGYTDEILS